NNFLEWFRHYREQSISLPKVSNAHYLK
ncbi:DNA polymerase III subunit theta, partial [Klebsiella aerogenes]